MVHVNEKQFRSNSQLWKDNFWQKKLKRKPSNILRDKKANGMKISRIIIYVKEYFYMLFSTLKDIVQTQSKTNH